VLDVPTLLASFNEYEKRWMLSLNWRESLGEEEGAGEAETADVYVNNSAGQMG